MQNPPSAQSPGKLFVLLNWSALVLSLLIVLLSTHIRLGEAGLGCNPWPECYAGLSLADGIKGLAIPVTEFRTFRAAHRYVASLLGINILLILIISFHKRRVISPGLPMLMFLVVLFLSILGVTTPTRSLPIVTLGNILGGIVLSGLVWRQILRLRSRSVIRGPFILVLLSVTLTLQLISGAWASANYTGSACPGLVTCTHTNNLSDKLVESFNLFRRLDLDKDDRLVLDESSSIIQFSHRLIAVLLLVLVLVALRKIKRECPDLMRPMMIVAVLFFAESGLGVFNILAEMPLWTNTLHNLLAVALLFSVINLTMLIRWQRA